MMRRAVIASLSFIVGLSLAGVDRAGAHTWSLSWSADAYYYIDTDAWPLRAGDPGIQRVKDAALVWTNTGPGWFDFWYGGTVYGYSEAYGCNGSELKDVIVQMSPITPAGVAHLCGSGSTITQAKIQMDTTPSNPWYADTGTPPGIYRDFWGAVEHELGHVTGSGHIELSCASSSIAHTMCSYHNLGTSYYRTLETHDKHAITENY